MFTQTKVLPKVLTFSQVKYYIFSAVFVGLAVATPAIFHQFNFAGPRFLPMHIFVRLADGITGRNFKSIVKFQHYSSAPYSNFARNHFGVSCLWLYRRSFEGKRFQFLVCSFGRYDFRQTSEGGFYIYRKFAGKFMGLYPDELAGNSFAIGPDSGSFLSFTKVFI